MAGGMHAVVLGSDLGEEMRRMRSPSLGPTASGGEDSDDAEAALERLTPRVLGSSSADIEEAPHFLERTDSVELVALPDGKSELAREILRERHQANRLVNKYSIEFCRRDKAERKKSKLPRRPGDELNPLLRMVRRRMPVLTWARGLTCTSVRSDIIAGLTVGVMLIPQSMSYAAIADLPYIYGLYSAFVPAATYAFFGMSRQLAVGPVAIVSLLVHAGLSGQLTEEECPEWYARGGAKSKSTQASLCPEAYANLAFVSAAIVGALMVLGSAVNLGVLVNLLGHPVVSGFTSGSAIIIGLSQLKDFVGYDIPKSEHVYETVAELVAGLGKLNGMTLALGLVWFVCLFTNKTLARRYKRLSLMGALGPLVGCIAGILLVWLCAPLRERFHVKYIGEIPRGLPPASLGAWTFGNAVRVLPTALSASLIGYMEAIAIAKSLATKHGYDISAGQEMFALGAANLAGALLSCYPTTGSFSRSAVAHASGATSQLAGAITSIVILCTLLFLTELFYFLPKFALAAVVVNAVIPLIDIDHARYLFQIKRTDFGLWVVAFLGTLLLGVLVGIAVAVGLSLCIVFYESVRPQITVLWGIPGSCPPIYRSIKQESQGAFIRSVFIARIGASMYFANVSYIKDMLLQYIMDLEEVNPIRYVILEMTPVTSIDSSAVHTIEDIVQDLANRGIQLAFAVVGNRVERTMRKARLMERIGEEWFFGTVHGAVEFCLQEGRRRRKSSAVAARRGAGASAEGIEEEDTEDPDSSSDSDSS